MSVVDRHSAQGLPVTEIVAPSTPSLNQQIYLRLRLALSLNLRRQIFIAICDDAMLRTQFVGQLETDLAGVPINQNCDADWHSKAARLISLNLNLENPDVLNQIRDSIDQSSTPAWTNFQIVGIDRLTRQPVHAQRSFLNSLTTIAQQLSTLEFNLVLWVTRPWCRSIQQSVPEFWRWHTALFEFEGDLFEPEPATKPLVVLNTPTSNRRSPHRERRVQLNSELSDLVVATVMQTVDLNDQAALSQLLEASHPNTEPLRILQQIETMHQNRVAAAAIAKTYRQLGDWYRDRLDPMRPVSTELTIVIRAYEQALKLIDLKSDSVPDLLNDIANLYWLKARSTDGSTTTNLEKALKAFQFALDRTDPTTQPQTYAMIQNNFGSVYSDLSGQQAPVENLQHAINAYRVSLQYRTFETDAPRYAATQNNLGTAHWNLAQHRDQMLNLQAAVLAYNEALRYYTPEHEPQYYAMLQNNLGTAYWNLSRSEQAIAEVAMAEDFLHLAIGAYRVALIYRTLEAAPLAFAATQNNLGTAYWHLANQTSLHSSDRPTYMLCAIDAYQEALSAVQYLTAASTDYAPPISFDLASTHHHIGLAYHQMAIDERSGLEPAERLKFLQQALRHQIQAAQGWQANPDVQPNAVHQLAQIVRAIHDRSGIQGQTQALSSIPPAFLPQIMKEL